MFMKKVKEEIVCGCCGHKFESVVVLSLQHRDFYLDGKPEYEHLLPDVTRCPNCQYVSVDIEDKVNTNIINTVNLTEYKDIFASSSEYVDYDALVYLSDNSASKINNNLNYCWKLEFDGKQEEANTVREKTVELMRKEISENPQVDLVLMYLDSLRLLARFDEAKKMLDEINSSIEENKDKLEQIYEIYCFEKKLIDNYDSKPHMISEVN